jgi:uncharacterized protein YdeI (YjbR/CyaY-like superfamily)
MKSKSGTRPPADLVRALTVRPTAKRVFENMRPSCQQRYAAPIQKAENREERKTKVANAVRGIIKYGNVHPRLKSKQYKKRETTMK